MLEQETREDDQPVRLPAVARAECQKACPRLGPLETIILGLFWLRMRRFLVPCYTSCEALRINSLKAHHTRKPILSTGGGNKRQKNLVGVLSYPTTQFF